MGRKSPNKTDGGHDGHLFPAPHDLRPGGHAADGGKNGSQRMTRKRSFIASLDGDAYNEKVRAIGLAVGSSSARNGATTTGASCGIDVVVTPPAEQLTPPPVKDPFCDPEHPKRIQFSDVSSAALDIKHGIQKTPCTLSNQLSRMLNMELFFKKDFLQVTGSFKERGARYALMKLPQEQREIGVIAASAGNHALALSYHGQQLGIPITVVMPLVAPLMKITLCRSYGANVIVKGQNMTEAKEIALQMGADKGLRYINGYDHPDILAGQGTLGLEILEQVDKVDAVIVPAGGAGLIAGVALAVKTLKPNVQVIGVESENCPSFKTSLEAGHIVTTKCGSTLADGLAVANIGVNALETAKHYVDKAITVTEASIALAILRLIEIEKAVVEGAGAVGLAALISGLVPELTGKRVVCILTGGNIDTTVLGRTIERGLAEDGRLVRFEAVVSDRPGGVAELSMLLAQSGASIKDIFHERSFLFNDIFSVRVKVVVETRDREHAKELETALKKRYQDVTFLM